MGARVIKHLTIATMVAGAALLGGCSNLPSTGPLRTEVEERATQVESNFILAELTENTLAILARRQPPTFRGAFGDYRPPSNQVIGIGDAIQVTIWEAAAGGLFSAPMVAGISAGARSAVIPDQVVARDGAITVPYAGRIPVIGRTTPQIEQTIVARLRGKAIEPQALVTVTRNVSNTATVTGEVTTGARVPLSVKGDRVLEVIALAGGVRAPVHETFITLARGNRSVMVPMQIVSRQPEENIFVRPNDTITVVRMPLTFTAVGATGRNAVVPFESVTLSLEEALARAGGLIDSRSDPAGVFVLRYESAATARELAPNRPIPPQVTHYPVIYQVNMREAASLFSARRFAMRDKDILYVSNAPLNELQKVAGLIQALTTPIYAGAAVISVAR